eukprot:10051448-Ditylum_brightwellii.AAC.1
MLGLTEETHVAQQVLNQALDPDPSLDEYTAGILKALAMSETIKAAGPIATNITVANFQQHWKKAKESTSSSILNLHFGHYKATMSNTTVGNIHALTLLQIP